MQSVCTFKGELGYAALSSAAAKKWGCICFNGRSFICMLVGRDCMPVLVLLQLLLLLQRRLQWLTLL